MKEYTPQFITRFLQKAHKKLKWWWAIYYVKVLQEEYFYVRGYASDNFQRIHKNRMAIWSNQERLDRLSQKIDHLYEVHGLEPPPKKPSDYDQWPLEDQP